MNLQTLKIFELPDIDFKQLFVMWTRKLQAETARNGKHKE